MLFPFIFIIQVDTFKVSLFPESRPFSFEIISLLRPEGRYYTFLLEGLPYNDDRVHCGQSTISEKITIKRGSSNILNLLVMIILAPIAIDEFKLSS